MMYEKKAPKIKITYRNDENARNKLIDLLINFLISNNTLMGDSYNENHFERSDNNG